MQWVELRRHSVRTLPEEGLSDGGRSLAIAEGRRSGPFALAISSPALRARQTAGAMGYPSPRIEEAWGPAGVTEALRQAWPVSFQAAKALLDRSESTRRLASDLLSSLRGALAEVPPGAAVLVVTHGGFPEVVAVSAFPRLDPRPWGGVLRCMEGVRLQFEGERTQRAEILRVPDELTRV